MASAPEKASNGGKKRKKSFYKNFRKKQRCGNVEADMKGFLVTFEKKEYDAARDCFSILNEYADKIWGPEGSVPEDADIQEQFEEELKALRNSDKKDRRFQKLKMGVAYNFFMRTTVEDPVLLVRTILEDLKRTGQQKSRFVLRLLPVLRTCKSHVEDVKKALEAVLSGYSEGPEETRYLAQCRVRNNSEMKNATLTTEVLEVVRRIKPKWVPDLKDPELVVAVDVVQNVTCLSLLRDYYEYKKYNLFELTKSGTRSEPTDHADETEEPSSKKPKTEDAGSDGGSGGKDATADREDDAG